MAQLIAENPEYLAKIESAISRAIVDASLSDDGSTAMVRTGEVLLACLKVSALFISGSETASSPTKRRELASDVEKTFLAWLNATRKANEAGEFPDFVSLNRNGIN